MGLSQKIKAPFSFQGESANDFYIDMLNTIRLEGERAAPRGLPTLELLHTVTHVLCPQRRVLTQYGRKLNPFFNMAESLWIMYGMSEAKWICYYNSQLEKYLDPPGFYFHGAYGERIRRWGTHRRTKSPHMPHDQLLDCLSHLRQHPDSRQALIVLWDPMYDQMSMQTLDRPCNVAIAFKVRHGQLHMSVFNRSNDVVLGLTSTNIVQFSTIQEVLASWLEVAVGIYSHFSDSLHLYESQAVTNHRPFNVYNYVVPTPMSQQSPWVFDQMLEELYRLSDPLRDLDVQDTDVLRRLTSQCPYWGSIGWALRAYRCHKVDQDWRSVLGCLNSMVAKDWQIECLRFMVDRYKDTGGFMDEAREFCGWLTEMSGSSDLEEYIFQSVGQ